MKFYLKKSTPTEDCDCSDLKICSGRGIDSEYDTVSVEFCCQHMAVNMLDRGVFEINPEQVPTGKLNKKGFAVTVPEYGLRLAKGTWDARMLSCPFCHTDIETVILENDTNAHE